MKQFFIRFMAGLFAVAMGCCASAQTPNAPSNFTITSNPINLSLSGLHVAGNQILNNLNQAVQLRGVNKDGLEYMCLSGSGTSYFDGPNDSASVALLQTWAINVVRLPVNEQCWLGVNGLPAFGTASAYQSAIEAYVTLLTSANIAVLLDLQWTAPGTNQANQLSPMPDSDHAVAFWTSAANAFKSNPMVIFDLFNEPYPDSYMGGDNSSSWSCLLTGGSSCTGMEWGGSTAYTATGMQSLVTAIRGTGATNIIMSPGISYENVLDSWLTYEPTDTLSPPQIAAAWHSYQGQTCSALSCFQSMVQPVLQSVPVITGEIGENDCATGYLNQIMPWLDGMGAHYVAWAWNTYNCGSFPSLISSYTTGTPTAFGVGVYNHLLSMSGQTPPAQAPLTYFSSTFPVGIAVGKSGTYTASDSTIYYGDQNSYPGIAYDFTTYGFATYSTSDTITGTSDPTLYQTGRYGQAAIWTINVPNGSYNVTFGVAPNSTHTTAGTTGQNQLIGGAYVANCAWTQTLQSSGGCGLTYAPAVDTAGTLTYSNISVLGQQIILEVAAAGTPTILSSIKITQNAPAVIPSAPVGLAVTPGNAQNSLSWTATSGATSYAVYRATSSLGIYTQIAGPTTNSYLDTGASNFQNYCYYLTAVSGAGASPYSASYVCATPITIPAVPTGVSATSALPGYVPLTWNAVTGATTYNVMRSTTSGSGYTTIATPSTNSYTDNSVTGGTTYYYVIESVNTAGHSANSSQVSATPAVVVACGSLPASGAWDSSTVVPYAPSAGQPAYTFTNRPMALVVDPFTPTTVWVDISDEGLYKSTTCGAPGSWVKVDTGTGSSTLDASSIWSMQIDPNPSRRGTIYAIFSYGPSTGLWKSTDNGVNWTQITVANSTISSYFWNNVTLDSSNTLHLAVTTHGGGPSGYSNGAIAESFDGGATWPNLVSMPQPWGEDGGVNLVPNTTSGTTSTWVWGSGDGENGTYLSTNSGASWSTVLSSGNDSALGEWNVQGLAKASNGYYYIPAVASIIKSSNGTTWTEAWPEINFGTPSVSAMGVTNSTIFAGGNAAVIYTAALSSDAAWAAMSPQPPLVNGQDIPGYFAYDATDHVLYISTYWNVFRLNVPSGLQ